MENEQEKIPYRFSTNSNPVVAKFNRVRDLPPLAPITGSPIIRRILGAFSFIIPLVVYYFTTCPVIYFGDAGELIVAAWRGGIAHPPGYPLYVILLAIFLRLPLQFLAPHTQFFQPIAWQANLFSAVVGAAAIWVLFLIVLRILRNHWWAFAAALLAATGKTFWSQTGISEVYTLNALLAGLVCLFALLMAETDPGSHRRKILFRYGTLCMGLSLANHHEMLFFGLVWLMMLKLALETDLSGEDRLAFRKRMLKDVLIFGGLGLLPYLYLPIASAFNPVLNWGHPSNPINFFKVITRYEYRGIKANITGDLVNSFDILVSFLIWTFKQYFIYIPLHAILAIPGFSIFFKRSRQQPVLLSIGLSLFFMCAAFIIYFAKIDRGSMFFLEVYFIPWYLAVAALATIGCATLFTLGTSSTIKIRTSVVVAVTLIVILFAGISGYSNQRESNMNDNIAGYIYSHDVLACLPPLPQKSLLITGGDEIFLFWYWQWVESIDKETAVIGLDALGVRRSWFWSDLQNDHPDFKIPDSTSLFTEYKGDELRWRFMDSLLKANLGVYRTYMSVWDRRLDPLLHDEPWHMVIDGPVLEIEHDTPKLIADYPRASVPEEQFLYKELLKVDRTGLDPYEIEIYKRYASACYNMAVYFSQDGNHSQAAHFASLCLQFDPGYSPGEHMTDPTDLLAFSLYKAGDYDLAKQMLEDLIKSDPNNSLYHYYMAGVYMAKDDRENAKREIGIALQLDPDNQFIVNLYRQLTGTDSQKQNGP
jgi:hypothetical protein